MIKFYNLGACYLRKQESIKANTTLKLSEFEMNALIKPYKLSQTGSILNKNKKVTDICIGDNRKQRKAAYVCFDYVPVNKIQSCQDRPTWVEPTLSI